MMCAAIRAGTWNIHEGISADGNSTPLQTELISPLEITNLDILALQEVPFGAGNESEILSSIATQTDLRYISTFPLSPSAFHRGIRSGIALASRVPHLLYSRVLLPNPKLHSARPDRDWVSWDKGMIITKMKIDNVSLWVCAFHGFPFHDFGRRAEEREFKRIWRTVADAINQLADSKIIVAGDFNSERRDLLTKLLQRPNITSAVGGATTHGNRSVDDILFDEGLACRSLSVVSGFSDHAFCHAEFSSLPEQL